MTLDIEDVLRVTPETCCNPLYCGVMLWFWIHGTDAEVPEQD